MRYYIYSFFFYDCMNNTYIPYRLIKSTHTQTNKHTHTRHTFSVLIQQWAVCLCAAWHKEVSLPTCGQVHLPKVGVHHWIVSQCQHIQFIEAWVRCTLLQIATKNLCSLEHEQTDYSILLYTTCTRSTYQSWGRTPYPWSPRLRGIIQLSHIGMYCETYD